MSQPRVKLIALSQPSAITDCHTAEQLVAYSARVSNPSNQSNKKTADKLVRYLIKENHWSPLEMVHMTMEIRTTRDIARQIIRHRSFSFQEFSQRYAEATVFEPRDARLQDEKNRQNSVPIDQDSDLAIRWRKKQEDVKRSSVEAYNWALKAGIAKEQARAVLPEGLTKTRLYMNGTLRSWIHYIELRSANGTQKEHMEVAKQCALEIAKIFPLMTKLT